MQSPPPTTAPPRWHLRDKAGRISGVRRALTWLLALPLIVVGSEVAHGLAYWWAYPIADIRGAILAHTGHGYLSYAPMFLSFLAAVELLVVVVFVCDSVRGHARPELPAWLFLWLPIVGFVVQEHLERLIATGSFPWWAAEAPTFWRGLVLQIPLGLAAYLLARMLHRATQAVAAVIARRRNSTPSDTRSLPSVCGTSALLPRLAPIALCAAGRAPPSPPA
jgi:hypothetical protein